MPKKVKTEPGLDRESLLRRALLLPEFPAFGEFRLRPFTLWTLDLCEEIGLEIFLALPKGKKAAGNHLFQVAALVWFHDQANTEDQVDAHLAAGTWRPEVERLLRGPHLAAEAEALADYVAFFSRLIQAASVRVKKKPKKKGEQSEAEPPNLLEPGGTFALIWSITGGHLADRDQFRFLYRGLSLPCLLSFYHCALRANLLWTVSPKPAGIDKKQRKKAALVRRDFFAKSKGAQPLDF